MVIPLSGYLFVKHVKWGTPKLRLVYVADDQLYWSETDYMYDRSKSKGSIQLSSIISIKDGLERAKKPKYYGPKKDLMLSIITHKRTVELEANT